MKAVIYNKNSFPERLVYCDTEKPVPGDNEVLVKVHAVSLNAADYRSMKMGIIPKNRIFGADIAGEIESTGKKISSFKAGDNVIGDLSGSGFGGLAEYVTAPEKALVMKPEGLSFEEGAALPMAALTALQGLRNKGNIQKGMKVLIIGSAGGVGTYTVQLAKFFGAEVTGICSTRNMQQTMSLGADHVIDYTKEDFTKKDKKYDIILAINGNYPLTSCRRILTSTGKYVMIGGALPQIFKALLFGPFLSFGSKKMMSLAAKHSRADLEYIADLAARCIIKPVIERYYLLYMAADAMSYIKQGHPAGKVVIKLIQK
jgi:NADPH:quinone reductase-like Zn-dependent oxidoreductase